MATFSEAPFVGKLINLSDAFPNAIPTTPIYANCHTLLLTYLQPDLEANYTHKMMFTLSANPAMTWEDFDPIGWGSRSYPLLDVTETNSLSVDIGQAPERPLGSVLYFNATLYRSHTYPNGDYYVSIAQICSLGDK